MKLIPSNGILLGLLVAIFLLLVTTYDPAGTAKAPSGTAVAEVVFGAEGVNSERVPIPLAKPKIPHRSSR